MVEYNYDAWGRFIVHGNSAIGNINPYKYRGYYFDNETGLYFLKTRYYNPDSGRFISMDDVAYIDPETIGGTNLFAYCNNNPVMNVDPNGTFLFGLFVGMLLGFTGSMVQDIVDDGELFNGSVKWHQYLGNIFISGGVGATIALGSAAIIAGLKSTAIQLVADGVSSLVTGTNSFESWESYAMSFVTSGFLKGTSKRIGKEKLSFKNALNVALDQLVKNLIKNNGSFSGAEYIASVTVNFAALLCNSEFLSGILGELILDTISTNFDW